MYLLTDTESFRHIFIACFHRMHLGVVAFTSVKAMPPAANRGEITESNGSGGSIIQST